MKNPNLYYLEKEWLKGHDAEKALNNFSKWNKQQLASVLRHHKEAAISDEETWRRDEFDYLLTFYSIVEIAIMIGFVQELPESFREKHLAVLGDEAVRRYYEKHYRLLLPDRLRRRLEVGIVEPPPTNASSNATFYDFLELTKMIERDAEIESFLWALDGGWRKDMGGECDIARVREGLANPARLEQAVQRVGPKQTELDAALTGFGKFIQFCEDMDVLLNRLKSEDAGLADALWYAHAYWFMKLNSKLGKNLESAFQSLASWKLKNEDAHALEQRIEELKDLMKRLSVPPTS